MLLLTPLRSLMMFPTSKQKQDQFFLRNMKTRTATSFFGFTAFIGVFRDGGVSVCS